MITIGCMTEHEAKEDVEISLAALEYRLPGQKNHTSPLLTTIISGELLNP
ncbi:MAG: hypothetical protein LLF96_09975 [Eubacteriales bacterium]|nr:hypothetical protein [Eubacteriales bacterium]